MALKIFAGQPKDATGAKVAPVEIPTTPIEPSESKPAAKPRRTPKGK